MSKCLDFNKFVIKTENGRLFIIHLAAYHNLIALKKEIAEHEAINIDQIDLYFCKEKLIYDFQKLDIYHRYFHLKYSKCMYYMPINIKLKEDGGENKKIIKF